MNNNGFTNADWTLFRRKVPEWQEAYMDKLTREYIQLLSSDSAPSERFWALEKRIKEDKHRAGVCIDMRRSLLFHNLMMLISEGVIGLSDLDGFSDEIKDRMDFFFKNRSESEEA